MILGTDERVDWFRVIVELQYAGLSYAKIGERVGVSETTVIGWKAGSHPRHADGVRLLALWQRHLDDAAEQVPVISAHDWRA